VLRWRLWRAGSTHRLRVFLGPALRAVSTATGGVVVLLGLSQTHRVGRLFHALLEGGEQLLLGPDEALPTVVGELVLGGHGQGTCGACLDAQPTEDAPQVVDLVDAAVAFTGRVPVVLGVVRGLHVDGVGRAGPGAQFAPDALLQPVGPPVQLVPSVEARRRGALDLRIFDGRPFVHMVWKVTPNPFTGLSHSSTGNLLTLVIAFGSGGRGRPRWFGEHAAAIVLCCARGHREPAEGRVLLSLARALRTPVGLLGTF